METQRGGAREAQLPGPSASSRARRALAVASLAAACAPAPPAAAPAAASSPSPVVVAVAPPQPPSSAPAWTLPVVEVATEPAEATDRMVAAVEAARDAGEEATLGAVLPHLGAVHRDCDAGSRLACWHWRGAMDLAVGLARKLGDAGRKMVASACDAGDPIACSVAAESLDHPSGVGGDPPAAVAGMMEACRAGFEGVCVRAARIRYGSGLAMKALSEEAAVATFDRACAQGWVEACGLVAYRTGAYDPNDVFGSPQLEAEARSCALGNRGSCKTMIEMVTPPAPFGCSRCDDAAVEEGRYRTVDGAYDERCLDCSIARCREAHCDTPEGDRYACCGEESAGRPRHPDEPPAPERQAFARGLKAVEAPLAEAAALWRAACERGHPGTCLDEALAQWLEPLVAPLR